MNKIATPILVSMGLLACVTMTPALKAESAGNAGLVQAAYTDLTTADHDYDGHRAAAAKIVKQFAVHHGMTLTEGVKAAGEAQGVSDGKLNDALVKLQQVVETDDAAAEAGKRKVRKERDKRLVAAVAEIKTALNVK